MRLGDVIARRPLEPWVEEEKIPWHDPGFSVRMLREHLSQDHDAASRRLVRVERHVRWIHGQLPGGPRGRVLDLGCGPGLYTSRLARLGCECVGVDFAPAAIEHARAEAEQQGLACEYRLRDLRLGEFGSGFDLVLLCNGELNVFRPEEAARILRAAHESLGVGGVLVLEVHTSEAVRQIGERPPRWRALAAGLFSDAPHLVLEEAAWQPERRAAVQRWFVVDASSAEVSRHGATVAAYTDGEYEALLREAGFEEVRRYASLAGDDAVQEDLLVLRARVAAPGAG